MAGHGIDLEAALLRLRQPVLDGVQVAVEEVDPFALDRQPGAAVDDAPPLPRRDDLSLVAEGADGVGVDAAAVVEPEVPVAIGPRRAARAGAAEGHRHDARHLCDPIDERVHAHRKCRLRVTPTLPRLSVMRGGACCGAAHDEGDGRSCTVR